MYKRHSIWDEDKWDIHSDRSDYAGHSSKESEEDYHKHETYNANKPEEEKGSDFYQSMKKEEDKKKEDEEKEKTIVDAVEQEEKYQKNKDEEEQEQIKIQEVAQEVQQNDIE